MKTENTKHIGGLKHCDVHDVDYQSFCIACSMIRSQPATPLNPSDWTIEQCRAWVDANVAEPDTAQTGDWTVERWRAAVVSEAAANANFDTADAKNCNHPDFAAHFNVIRLKDSGRFSADVTINCSRCGTPFRFLGLPAGVDFNGAAVSVDGTEARLAIGPPSAIENVIEGGDVGFTIRREAPPRPLLDLASTDGHVVLFSAVRYALGRQSYVPSSVIAAVRLALPTMDVGRRASLANDIRRAEQGDQLGDPNIDAPAWLALLAELENPNV